jgi:sarcosine oxidase subunit beta
MSDSAPAPTSASTPATVAVVGGGIVGLASAYELAGAGHDVVVLEKSHLGAGSTGRSGGGIRSQFSTPLNVRLSEYSKRVWDDFESEFGVDIRHRRVGYLFLAREAETDEGLRADVEMQRGLDVPVEHLTPEAAREHCPALYADRFRGAAYCPTDEFVDPYLALQGYADGCRRRGVDLRVGVEVTDVETDATGRVRGLAWTDANADADGSDVDGGGGAGDESEGEGRLDADYVLNAAGPWAGRVAATAGVDLPVEPELHRLAFVRPDPPIPEDVPLTVDLDTGSVFRPEADDVAAVGGHVGDRPTADPDRVPESVSLDWQLAVLEAVADVCGYFGPDSRVTDTLAGLYAMTPDTNPIVEETRPGLLTAAGFSGHGFMHAPATARIVAELVADGECSTFDVSAFASDRFADDVAPERNLI